MNIITRWMISPPRRGKWFLSTGRAEMAVISEQDLDGLIAEIGVGLKPGTVRAQTRTEIGTLIAVAKRGDPRRVTRDGAREGFEPVFSPPFKPFSAPFSSSSSASAYAINSA
jgi:hypothetical protein